MESQGCAPAACGGSGHSRGRSPRHRHPRRATGAAAARSRVHRAPRRPARGSWRCPAPTAAARTAAQGTGAPASAGPPPAQPDTLIQVARLVGPFLFSSTEKPLSGWTETRYFLLFSCNRRNLILPTTPTPVKHHSRLQHQQLGPSLLEELIRHSCAYWPCSIMPPFLSNPILTLGGGTRRSMGVLKHRTLLIPSQVEAPSGYTACRERQGPPGG